MNTYKGLSTYLNNSFNENLITEGFFDFFGGNKKSKPTDEQKQATGFFGMFWCGLKRAAGVESAEDPLMTKMNSIAENELKEQEKRIQDELNAYNKQEIAKLEAKAAYKKAQLDTASRNKIKAYQANEKKLKAVKAQIDNANKNGTFLLHSAEESQAFLDGIAEIGKNIDPTMDSPARQMTDLFKAIMIKPDGNTRTLDDIKSILAKTDSDLTDEEKEIAANVKAYNEIAKKNNKSLLEGMNSEAFNKFFKEKINKAGNAAELESELKYLTDEQDELVKIEKAVNRCAEIQKEYDDAVKEANEAETKLKNLTTGVLGQKEEDKDGNITVKPVGKDDFISKIKDSIKEQDLLDDKGNFKADKIKSILESKGFTQSQIESLNLNLDEVTDIDAIKEQLGTKISELKQEDFDNLAKDIANKTQQDIVAAKSALETAEATKEKKVNLADPNLSEDDKKAKLEQHYSAEDVSSFNLKTTTPDTRLADAKSDPKSKHREQLEAEITKTKNKIKKNESAIEANKKAREEAVSDIKYRTENNIPADLKDKVEKYAQGLEPGESIKTDSDGKIKIGFNIKNKNGQDEWVPKPGPNASEEDVKKYIEQRNAKLLLSNIEDEKSEIKSVKKEGNTYKVIKSDGKPETYSSPDDDDKIVSLIAAKKNADLTQSIMLDRKQKVADVLTKCISDGKFDIKKFKELNLGEEALTDIKNVINSGNPADVFKGLDFNAATVSAVKKALKADSDDKDNVIQDLNKYFEEKFDDEDFENSNEDDYEDVEDEDEDLKDDEDKESDEEDEENAKNEAGDKLVKGDDGKWYKAKEDGTADKEAGEQENKSKKILKNPAKIWKRKKKKNGKGTTKSYYNKEGESISADEYKEKVNSYKKAKKKQSQQDNQSLSNSLANLLESKHTKTKTIKYTELRDRLLNSFN